MPRIPLALAALLLATPLIAQSGYPAAQRAADSAQALAFFRRNIAAIHHRRPSHARFAGGWRSYSVLAPRRIANRLTPIAPERRSSSTSDSGSGIGLASIGSTPSAERLGERPPQDAAGRSTDGFGRSSLLADEEPVDDPTHPGDRNEKRSPPLTPATEPGLS